jgi:hypothetical protein
VVQDTPVMFKGAVLALPKELQYVFPRHLLFIEGKLEGSLWKYHT